MNIQLERYIIYFIVMGIFLLTPLFHNAQAQNTGDECVVIEIPGSLIKSSPPPGCNAVGQDGITYPTNMTCKPDGYCQLQHPQPPNGSYRALNCQSKYFGHKDLVGVLYTVSERWKQKYPSGFLRIGDLNGAGHKTHNKGYAVDLDATTNGTDCVADYVAGGLARNCGGGNYNREATVELGKMFVDTNSIRQILYMDQSVNSAVMEYARQTNKSPGMNMFPVARHDNHFHVDVRIENLPFWEPGC